MLTKLGPALFYRKSIQFHFIFKRFFQILCKKPFLKPLLPAISPAESCWTRFMIHFRDL
jgi:hypothetical protein